MYLFRKIQECIRARRAREAVLSRTIFIGGQIPPGSEITFQKKFPNNRIVTSKYTVWNFLPKNLFEQFRRIANLYFLGTAIIQLLIDSPVSPLTSSTPLLFVVTVTAIKQAFEDWRRHQADNAVNFEIVYIIQNGKLAQIVSKDVKVGDIVLVRDDSSFPCDLVLLSSNEKDGVCHVTTANLDGETNLKRYFASRGTYLYRNAKLLSIIRGTIECETPTPNLYKFIGRLTLYRANDKIQVYSLGPENLLLRGSRLKNTKYIFGCAVYTGQDTKMALNSRMQSNKFSTIEKTMNIFLVVFLLFLVLEICTCTLLHFYTNVPRYHWYLKPFKAKTSDILQVALSFLILLNYIIPISMYVTIEMQKFLGSMFFVWDEDLYDKASNQSAKCNSSDLNEELGQVNYLFTDKTGTLTENDMQFRCCSISGEYYIENDEQLYDEAAFQQGETKLVDNANFEIRMFFLVLALCHTVHISLHKTNLGDGSYITELHASSPDEKALVEACCRFGILFREIRDNFYALEMFGEIHIYQRLQILEFDSDRKCMSVIVRQEDGTIYLLNKGAESSFMGKNLKGPFKDTLKHVNEFAMIGLRTLVLGYRVLTEDEYTEYGRNIQEAKISLVDREALVAEANQNVENSLTVIGAVGVEDRLQDGVKETLQALKDAGIKVWILTGDKMETAINISHSCGHFQTSTISLSLIGQLNITECWASLDGLNAIIKGEPNQPYGLIVDGVSLSYALQPNCQAIFSEVSKKCDAVICCRMSPLQKAEVVKLIKKDKSHPVTAAIGDGANDCSMIQEAHVGLGIMGKEGRQAVRCSDFAFARFRFLRKVFLVHGHYFYIRVATLVQFFFYKNFAFITPQIYFATYTAYSTQTLYDGVYLSLFNILFTSLPILIYGLMEQDEPARVLLQVPLLYRYIARNALLTAGEFIKWIAFGVWHSVVIYFGAMLCFSDVSLDSTGRMLGLWTFGTFIYHLAVMVVNLKLVTVARYITWVFFGAVVLSVLGFIGFGLFYTGINWHYLGISNTFYWVYIQILLTGNLWIALIIILSTAVIPDIIYMVLFNHYRNVKHQRHTVTLNTYANDYHDHDASDE